MTDEKKTHGFRAKPGMSIRMLADYMSASEQAKRTLLTKCKYPPIAPVIQHKDAQESIADRLSRVGATDDDIVSRSETLRSGLQGTPFEIEVAENNADYLDRYLEVPFAIPPRVQTVERGDKMPPLQIEGFNLTCTPHLLFKRVNRRNTPKIGLGFFRYARGKALPIETACWQSAIGFGYLKTKLEQGLGEIDPERDLCIVFDVWTGKSHSAPGNAVYRFNEVRAICAGIAQRWGNIPPPQGAVY